MKQNTGRKQHQKSLTAISKTFEFCLTKKYGVDFARGTEARLTLCIRGAVTEVSPRSGNKADPGGSRLQTATLTIKRKNQEGLSDESMNQADASQLLSALCYLFDGQAALGAEEGILQ